MITATNDSNCSDAFFFIIIVLIMMTATNDSNYSDTVAQRIKYKVSCLCFQVLTGTAPSYISQLLTVYVPSRSLRSSTDDRLFRVPRYSREAHGGRAFTSSAVKIWNSLPQNVRHSPSLPTFKRNLKTFLFQQAFF